MAANGQVSIAWGDGEHVFNIAKIGQLLELEEKCGVGVAEVFNRLREGRWRFNDVRETVRLGLIGGGMTPVKALALTKTYTDERPLAESHPVAMTILMAAIVGVPGEEVGKKKPEEAKAETPPSGSPAPASTEEGLSSAGRLERLMNAPFSSSLQELTPTIEPKEGTTSPSP